MKICGYCGKENKESSKFCIGCGAALGDAYGQGYGSGSAADGYTQSRGPAYGGAGGYSGEEIIYTDVAPRSIAVAVILSIVTFGIYNLYWIYCLNRDVNDMAQDPDAMGSALVLVLWIVTLGIYGLVWYYQMGKKCDYIAQTNGSKHILFLILGILGLGLVAQALIQDTINTVLS